MSESLIPQSLKDAIAAAVDEGWIEEAECYSESEIVRAVCAVIEEHLEQVGRVDPSGKLIYGEFAFTYPPVFRFLSEPRPA